MARVKITEQIFRAVLINEIKKYVEECAVKPPEAFKDVVSKYYYYSIGQLGQAGTNENKASYIAMMYDFIFNGSTLSNKWFDLICRYYQYGCEFCELDKEYLKLIRSAVIEEQEHFYKLEVGTEQTRRILEHQEFMTVIETINPLIEFYEATNVSSVDILINIFNLGYITGIRKERARRKAVM